MGSTRSEFKSRQFLTIAIAESEGYSSRWFLTLAIRLTGLSIEPYRNDSVGQTDSIGSSGKNEAVRIRDTDMYVNRAGRIAHERGETCDSVPSASPISRIRIQFYRVTRQGGIQYCIYQSSFSCRPVSSSHLLK
jgi:hypothetical protein